jgi:hypothetical protein
MTASNSSLNRVRHSGCERSRYVVALYRIPRRIAAADDKRASFDDKDIRAGNVVVVL